MSNEFTFHEWTARLKSLAQTAITNMTMIGTLREHLQAFRDLALQPKTDWKAQATVWIEEAEASLTASHNVFDAFLQYKIERKRIGLDTTGAEIAEEFLQRTLCLLRETCFELQAMIR